MSQHHKTTNMQAQKLKFKGECKDDDARCWLCKHCYVDVPVVQDFEHGLVLMGNNAGCAYNKVMMGSLWENHNNHVLDTAGVNGYTNENTFIGGRLRHSPTKGATANDPNAHQILAVGMNAEGGPNNNRWIGTSLEGQQVAQYRIEMAGSHNQFLHCRWESPNNDPIPIKWRDPAVSNVLFYGYGLVNVVEVFEKTNGTISPSIRFDSAGLYLSSTTAVAGQVIPNNTITDITTWNSTPTMRGMTYNTTTGEFTPRPGRWEIDAKVAFAINGTGRRQAYLIGGGLNMDDDEVVPSSTNRNVLRLSGERRFNGSETFKVQVSQTSSSDLALETSSGRVRIRAKYLGG